MGKKLSEEIAVDSDDSMEDVSDVKAGAESESSSESNSHQTETSSTSNSDSDSESEAEAQSQTKVTSNTSTERPAPFRAPPGFTKATTKSRSKPSPATSALSNLEGKQIFHIAAPSFLPLSQIREIALDKALLGEPVISHKGVDYGIQSGEAATAATNSQSLLVYDENKGAYIKKDVSNIQSYTVQELVRLPNHAVPVVKSEEPARRPQPKHLKMRFHPVGSGNLGPETIGSSSESEADDEDNARTHEHKRKSKGHDEDEKKKKKKKEKHTSSPVAEKRGRADGEGAKKASKQRDETSQERRARKEKKKHKAGK